MSHDTLTRLGGKPFLRSLGVTYDGGEFGTLYLRAEGLAEDHLLAVSLTEEGRFDVKYQREACPHAPYSRAYGMTKASVIAWLSSVLRSERARRVAALRAPTTT